ncbi:hypothetical protein FACS1894130_07260 [Spirochaetia bacterium]|nr:hypothetical protein FACS1894130_07260 [Spirochaetia bacterium]
MLIAIIGVSILTVIAIFTAIVALVGVIINFKKDIEKRKKCLFQLIISIILFIVLGGVNTYLIIKYVYDNREIIAEKADAAINTAIDKTAEYSTRGVLATASAYNKSYNASIIKQFENLAISFSSSTFEIKDGKKVYEIEVLLDNKIPQNEEIYFGNLVAKNYLIACDADEFVYDIVPMDTDAGFSNSSELISFFEFLLDREYSKYGKILPGKTKHKILAMVPENVDIVSLRFLDKQIDVR